MWNQANRCRERVNRMISRIYDITESMDWIDSMICNEELSTPLYDRERVLSVSRKDSSLLLETCDGSRRTGVFCLMVLDAEKYIETLFLYAGEKQAYDELLGYLASAYPGYEAWFVFNPGNRALRTCLCQRRAFFYPEQRYMEYQGPAQKDVAEIIPYSDQYRNDYISLHSRDGYWDGEKVLDKLADFHIFLCIKDGRPVGYIDLSKQEGTNEIMDVLVSSAYRNRGIGALLLKKAIFANGARRLVLTVDVDNAPANHLYTKLGFVQLRANNSVTAKLGM